MGSYTEDLKILISGDEKQAAAALENLQKELGKLDDQTRKTAGGMGWNRREAMQMTGAMQSAAMSAGGMSTSGRFLPSVMGELNEKLGEVAGQGKITGAQLKSMMAGMAVGGAIMVAAAALEWYGKKLKEAADNAEALSNASRDLVQAFMQDMNQERMQKQARAYEEGRISFKNYHAWLLSEEAKHLANMDRLRKQAMAETDGKQKAELVNSWKTQNALQNQFNELAYQTEKAHTERVRKERADKEKKATEAKRKETENRIKLALHESEIEKAIADFEVETEQAVAEYQGELTQAKMQMALDYGNVVGDYIAQAANGQMMVEQAAANAVIDIFADMLTKKLAAWAAANAGMGNFLKAGAAMAAIVAVKSILKHSFGGGATIAPVSIVPSSTTLPSVPGAGSGGGGGATGGAGAERGAPVASQIGEITIYQSIYINGNVMASNFYRTVMEASAAGARAGGR